MMLDSVIAKVRGLAGLQPSKILAILKSPITSKLNIPVEFSPIAPACIARTERDHRTPCPRLVGSGGQEAIQQVASDPFDLRVAVQQSGHPFGAARMEHFARAADYSVHEDTHGYNARLSLLLMLTF